MLGGDLYLPSDPELRERKLRAAFLLDQLNRSAPDGLVERRRILDDLLGAIGVESEIRPPFFCGYGSQICIGARTFVNVGCVFLDVGAITIGDDVQIGSNVQLLTPTHPLEPELRRGEVGSRGADHHPRQRLARRRRHRPAGRHHRREHRGRCRSGGALAICPPTSWQSGIPLGSSVRCSGYRASKARARRSTVGRPTVSHVARTSARSPRARSPSPGAARWSSIRAQSSRVRARQVTAPLLRLHRGGLRRSARRPRRTGRASRATRRRSGRPRRRRPRSTRTDRGTVRGGRGGLRRWPRSPSYALMSAKMHSDEQPEVVVRNGGEVVDGAGPQDARAPPRGGRARRG